MPFLFLLVLVSMLTAGCRDHREGLTEDAGFGRRVLPPPPTGEVRALPPHNIHVDGVGPYKLGASFQKTLSLLPNGPRVEVFKSSGLFDYRLMPTDNGALVVGVRAKTVEFISVLDPDIARTESGVGVGAGFEELRGALGEVMSPRYGHDSRLVTFSSLPSTRFVIDEEGRVLAAVVSPPEEEETPAFSSVCSAASLLDRKQLALDVAGLGDNANVIATCWLGTAGELIVWEDRRVHILAPQGEGFQLVGTGDVAGLSFLTTVESGGKVDLYGLTQRLVEDEREVAVTRFRLASGRLTPSWSRQAFAFDAQQARWIGANLNRSEFLLELRSREGAVEVGGLYLQRDGRGELRHVVPIERLAIPTGQKPRGSEEPDAGIEPPMDGSPTKP